MLGLVEVPEHGCAVFAAGGAEGAVGGDGYGIDVAGVADVVGLDAAGGEFPDLGSKKMSATTYQSIESPQSPQSLHCCHQCIGDCLSHSSKALK